MFNTTHDFWSKAANLFLSFALVWVSDICLLTSVQVHDDDELWGFFPLVCIFLLRNNISAISIESEVEKKVKGNRSWLIPFCKNPIKLYPKTTI